MKCSWCEKPLPWRGKLAVMRNPYRFIHCGRPECEESKREADRRMTELTMRMWKH